MKMTQVADSQQELLASSRREESGLLRATRKEMTDGIRNGRMAWF